MQGKLTKIIKRAIDSFQCGHKNKPLMSYEASRRKLRSMIDIFWFKKKVALQQAQKHKTSITNEMVASGSQLHNLMLATFDRMVESDGFQPWREKEAFELS